MKVAAVIPVFNGWSETRTCLQRLRASRYPDLRVYVVDHGSTDGTAMGLVEFPEVTRVVASSDLWWSGACNRGIAAARQEGATHIVLLNNDSYVEADTLDRLVTHAAMVPDAVIAPLQSSLQSGKTWVPAATTCFLLGFPTLALHRAVRPDRVLTEARLILGGRGTLIPVSVFDRVGLLDEENLPHYGADHDFYLRCRRRGVRLLIAHDARVIVDEHRTTLAARARHLSFPAFLTTFHDRRSHRNLRDLTALFRLHYPIKGLHLLGVGLNVARYTSLYLVQRAVDRIRGRLR